MLMLLLALQTGLRLSELIKLKWGDVILGTGAHVRCEGKGRKQRTTPLRRDTIKMVQAWLRECAGKDDEPVFPTIRGDRLSRDAVEHIVRKYTVAASKACATLKGNGSARMSCAIPRPWIYSKAVSTER